jgi:hypothetical protein
MQRLLPLAALCLCASVSAQTTIDITVPGNNVCSYTTGPVTAGSTAGHLQATATGSTGAGCGISGSNPAVSFGPASPLAPPAVSVPTAGGSASFTFQPVNATACTGSITPSSGTAFTTTFCSSANGCGALQTVTASFPANASTTTDATYTVSVSCTGLGSPSPGVTSPASSVVTVPHPGGSVGCSSPPTIAGTGAITSFNRQTGNQAMTSYGTYSWTADVTDYISIFGSKPTPTTWPGNSGITADKLSINTNAYISAMFQVPSSYMGSLPSGSQRLGQFLINNSGFSKAPVSMTISTSCGDFSNPANFPGTSTVVPGCYLNAGTSLVWENPQHNSPTCVLQDGGTYFLNIINANVSNITPTGGTATTTKGATGASCGTACTDPITNYIFN